MTKTDQDREDFEAWASSTLKMTIMVRYEGSYMGAAADYCWITWQAALAHERAHAAPVASHEPESVINNAGCTSSVGDSEITCPICAAPFRAGDICGTDINEGACHAYCLEGSPVVDLETGEEIEGPAATFPWEPGPAPPPEPAKAEECDAPERIRKRISYVVGQEGLDGAAAFWRPCTGCHETSEGYSVGFPHSNVFDCEVGSGCQECGGLGVVWEHYSAEDLAEMAKYAGHPALATPPTAPAAARRAAEEMRERCAKIAEERADTTCDDAVYMELTQVTEDILALPLPGEAEESPLAKLAREMREGTARFRNADGSVTGEEA